MPRDSSAYFDDILDAISAIRDFTQSLIRDDFGHDRKTVDAVLRNLEVMAEGASRTTRGVVRASCFAISSACGSVWSGCASGSPVADAIVRTGLPEA